MKVRVVKYVCTLSAHTEMECMEHMPGCEEKAGLHVCLEGGGSTFVCRSCFDARANKGEWKTDRAELLMAS